MCPGACCVFADVTCPLGGQPSNRQRRSRCPAIDRKASNASRFVLALITRRYRQMGITMELKSLGYVGIRSTRLDDWSSFSTKLLGMQEVDLVRVYRTFHAAAEPFRTESEAHE